MKLPDLFAPQLTRRDIWLGRCWLPIHIFVIPLLLELFAEVSGVEISPARSNALYYIISMAFILLFLGKYLRRTLEPLCDHPGWSGWVAFSGYLIHMFLSGIVGLGAMMFAGEQGASPTAVAAAELLAENPRAVFCVVCVLAPVVEETLFRGVLLGGALAKGRRKWGYISSIVLFAIYHVWMLPFTGYGWQSLLYAILYVPAGVVLARTYEMSGSLWTGIILHAVINAVSVITMLMMG